MALQEETKALINENLKQFNQPFLNPDLYTALQKHPIYQSVDITGVEGGVYDFGATPIPKQHPALTKRLGELYDPTLSYNMERLAQDQSAFERWTKFIPRVGVKIASEVAQIPGYLGGAVDWATTGFAPEEIGRMVDNKWLQGVQQAEEYAKENGLAIFVPESVQEGGLMRNLASSSFWATEGADAIGFLLAMLVPGQILRAAKAGKAVAAIPRLIKPGYAASETAIGAIDDVLATGVNTVYEAGAEAGETYRNVLNKTGDKNIAGDAAAQTFRSNMLILLGPNYLQQKWLINGFVKGKAFGVPSTSRALETALGTMVDKETGAFVTGLATKTPWTKLSHGARVGLGGVFTEGFWEEGSQFATQKYAEEKATKGEDTNILQDIAGTVETYFDNITETDMQKNVFLGAFMGFFMGGVGGVREVGQYERLVRGTEEKKRGALGRFFGMQDLAKTPGLHTLLKDNYVERYETFMDLVEYEADGKTVKLDETTGKPKLNPQKVKEFTAERMRDVYTKHVMGQLLRNSDEEGFEYLKMTQDLNYMTPFLRQPGGLEILKAHINQLSKTDAKFFEDKYGLKIDVEDIKKDLLEKSDKFQEVYTRISDTHNPSLRVKYDKADQDTYNGFSGLVLSNKLSESARQYHSIKRINLLRDRLASYMKGDRTVSITSTETKPSKKMVAELEESLKKVTIDANLSETDVNVLSKYIKGIGKHSEMLDESLKKEKSLYNNKDLQKQYNDYIADRKKTNQAVHDTEQQLLKDQTATGVATSLQPLYDEAVKLDKTTINGEEVQIGYSGEVTINFTNKDGTANSDVFLVEPDRFTPQGSLILKHKSNPKVEANLNPDGTIFYRGEVLSIVGTPTVTKPVTEVISDLNAQSLVNSLQESISYYNTEISTIINDIQKTANNINEVTEKLQKLQEKEAESLMRTGTQLTRKGTQRVESVKIVKDSSQNAIRMFLTIDQMRNELSVLNNQLSELNDKKDNRKTRIQELLKEKELIQTKALPYIKEVDPIDVLEQTISLISQQVVGIDESLASAQALYDSSNKHLKQLYSVLKGYNTTLARILKVSDELVGIRNRTDLPQEAKDLLENDLILDAIERQQSIEVDKLGLSADEWSDIAAIGFNKENIDIKVAALQNSIKQTEDVINKNKESLAEYNRTLAKKQKIKDAFYTYHLKFLKKLGLVTIPVDKATRDKQTKEPFFGKLGDGERDETTKWEVDYKHPFDGKIDSWLVTTADQKILRDYDSNSAMQKQYTPDDIKDMIRWRIFVNKYVYWTFKKGKLKKQPRFVFKSYSYDVVAGLAQDDLVRKGLKFWTGENTGFKTYDEILSLPEEAKAIARNDIKVVVYERKVDKAERVVANLLTATDTGTIDATKQSIFFTSMVAPSEFTANDFVRFSTKNQENAYKKAALAKGVIVTDKEASDYVQEKLKQSLAEYNKYREEVLKTKSEVFTMSSVTPGVKVFDGAVPTELEDATGVDAEDLYLRIVSNIRQPVGTPVDKKISNTMQPVLNGLMYLGNRSRYESIKPKTFDVTGDVDNIINLFRYLATTEENFTVVESYLNKIIYTTNEPGKWRLAIGRTIKGEKIVKNTLDKVFFGDSGGIVTREQLVNNQNLDGFRKFLKEKYWNFDKLSLKNNTFTEIIVTEKGGKLIYEEKPWAKTGGYKGFLFSSKGGNHTKGTVYVKPRPKSDVQETKDAQYLNQAVMLQSVPDGDLSMLNVPSKEGSIFYNPAAKTFGVEKREFNSNDIFDQTITERSDLKDFENVTGTDKIDLTNIGGAIVETAVVATKTIRVDLTKLDEISPENIVTISGEELLSHDEELGRGASSLDMGDILAKSLKPENLAEKPKGEKPTVLTFQQVPESVRKHFIDKYGDNAEAKFNENQANISGRTRERLATRIDGYKLINQAKTFRWLNARFPDFPKEVVEGLIDEKSWGQLKEGVLLLISDLAEEGTEYHEGFHIVSNIFITPEERASLYTEAKETFGLQDKTDDEVEEFLAEEFRMYMLSPSSYQFGKKQGVQKTLFQRILDAIKHFVERYFGIQFTTPSEVESMFKKIENGKFLLRDRVSETSKTFNSIAKLPEAESAAYLREMTLRFFNAIFKNNEVSESVIFELGKPEFSNEVYKVLKSDYENELLLYAYSKGLDSKNLPADFQSKETQILNNWSDLIKRHGEFMLQYGVDLRNDLIEDDEEFVEKEKDSQQFVESNLTSPKEIYPKAIRMLIASLPSVAQNGGLTVSAYQTNSIVTYDRIMNYLNNNLAQIDSFVDMAYKLQSLAIDKPELTVLLERLGITKELDDKEVNKWADSITNTKLLLAVQFYKAFAHKKDSPKILLFEAGGKKHWINAVPETEIDIIKNKWLNLAKASVGEAASFIGRSQKTGKYVINKEKLLKAVDELKAITNLGDKQAKALKILKGLGIVLAKSDTEVRDFDIVGKYLNRLVQSVQQIKGDLLLDDISNRDVVKNQGEFRALLEYATGLITNDIDLMFFNHQGRSQYSIGLNSHVTNTLTRLSSIDIDEIDPRTGKVAIPRSVRYLMPYDGYEGNLFSTHSSYLNDVILKGGKLQLYLLQGAKTGTVQGKDTSKLTSGDYKALVLNATLNNIIPLLRAECRKTEYALFAKKTDYSVTSTTFVNDARDYLKDELMTSFALMINPDKFGGNLANYKTNALSLRQFDFLYDNKFTGGNKLPTLENFVKDNVTEEEKESYLKSEQFEALANKFVDENKEFIDETLNKYLDTSIDLNIASLIESEVIGKAPKGYYVPGIDIDIIKSAGIKPLSNNSITDDDLRHLIKVATYNYFVGTQEQLKLFFGDLAMYENVDRVHKRTTGALSTRYNTLNDSFLQKTLDRLYERLDKAKHDYVITKVLFKDKKPETNPELVKVSEYYGKDIIGTDSQAWATPDEIRSIKLRAGEWFPEHEQTYQYEMQRLALELFKPENADLLKIFSIAESEFTADDGFFYGHTGGIIPTTPMFNGEVIDINKPLTPIAPMKPQGFGNIENITGTNAVQYYKLSLGTMLPSVMIDTNNRDGLKLMLQMMSEGDGILSFPSSEKATYIDSTDTTELGELFTDDVNADSVVQNINFDHFGVQMDIHDETDGRVRVATQRTRLEYINLFDKGVPVEGKQAVEYDTYNSITNEILTRDFSDTVEDFGLKRNEGDIYSLVNKDKFKAVLDKLFVQRLLPFNVIDGIDLVLNSEQQLFDCLVNRNKIQEVLLAYIRNNIVRRKTAGDFLVQESSAIYSEDLKFYRKGKSRTLPMEVMIPLPKELLQLVNSVGGLGAFNNLIQEFRKENPDPKIVNKIKEQLGDIDKILTISGVRIPVNGLGSMEAMHIAKFLPYHAGQRIIVPPELTVKAGSDFDVDKLNTYYKNFNMYQGKINYYDYLDDTNSKLEDRLSIYAEYDLASKLGDEYINAKDTIKLNYQLEKSKELRAKDFANWSIEKQNVSPALENKLNEISFNNLTELSRFEDLLTPVRADYLNSLADDVKKSKDQTVLDDADNSFDWSKATQMWFNFRKAEEFWETKYMIGMAAVQNTSVATLQLSPIKIADPRVRIMFKGQMEGQYIGGHMYDSEGRLVSDNHSEFVSAFVDAGKNPDVIHLNAEVGNFNAYSFLNRFGVESGVGMSTLVSFFTNEVATEYIKTYNTKYRNMLLYANQYRKNDFTKYPEEIVDDMLTKYKAKSIKGMPNTYEDTLAFAYDKYFNAEVGTVERDKWGKIIDERLVKYDYKPLTKGMLKGKLSNELKIQILDNLLMYRQYGIHLMNLNRALRVDAGLESTLNSIDAKFIIHENVLKNGFFDATDVQNVFNNTFLKGFLKVKQETKGVFGWGFITRKSPVVYNFFENEFIKPFTRRLWNEQKRNKVLKLIEDEFITYLVNTVGVTTEAVKNDYKRTIQGDKSTGKLLVLIKGEKNHDVLLVNNDLIKELEPILAEYNKATKKNSEVDYVSTFNKRLDVYSQNLLTGNWMDLFKHPNKKVVGYAVQLIKQAMYQNGFKDSPTSLIKLIPNSVFIHLAEKKLGKFLSLPEENQLQMLRSFKKQMYRNNWNNRDLEPRRRKMQYGGAEDNTGYFRPYKPQLVQKLSKTDPFGDFLSPKELNYEYITHSYFAIDRSDAISMLNAGQSPPMFTVLYERGKNTADGRVTFNAVAKLGDGNRFVEYYPASAEDIDFGVVKSIIAENNTQPSIAHLSGEDVPQNYEVPPITEINESEDVDEGIQITTDKETIIPPKTGGKELFGIEPTKVRSWEEYEEERFGPGIQQSYQGIVQQIKALEESLGIKPFARFKHVGPRVAAPITGLNTRAAKELKRRGELYGLETLPRIKEILAELNNPALTKEQKDALGEELGSLYWAPGEMVTREEKAAMRKKELGALLKSPSIPADVQLNQMMKDFFSAAGFTYQSSQVITDKLGNDVPEAVAVARLTKMTVEAIENKLDITHLPEEASHIYIGLLDKNSNLYKSMYNKIVNYPIYNIVKERYKDLYKEDETLFREEAIGQLIAKHIVNLYQGRDTDLTDVQNRQVNTWWSALWSYLKSLFGKVHTSPFVSSAYNIMNKRLTELELNAQNKPTGEFYGLESSNWDDLYADKIVGNVKFRYFRNQRDAENYARDAIETFGADNVSVLPQSSGKWKAKVAIKKVDISKSTNEEVKKVAADNNFKELRKEGEFTGGEKELFDNFDKYYPQYSHFNSIEKEGFVKALALGEIEQICGI